MPQGDKRHYTQKQKRQAEHIEESFEERGYPPKEAAGRAWAVVNAIHKGGELKGGGGYGKPEDKSIYRKGGRRGGRSAKGRPTARQGKAARRAKPAGRGRRTKGR
ncbi:MAG TPA: plasmid stabilization protein [Candidatus Thermoplasmatota archaeon]|nr:plasmid stabilization protein [Candidatus Thermoplasmatota archaeon]